MSINITKIRGVIAPIDRDNIDTDQIIPTEYLKSIKKFGFEDYLFDGWRYLDEGKLGITRDNRKINHTFILNKPPYLKSVAILSRENFGCGSSREHAVWALRDFGIKTVIASSFGDIFYNNCFKNGVLPITLSKELVNELFLMSENKILNVTVDLNKKKISVEDLHEEFMVDDNLLERIIFNLDDIDMTLKNKKIIKDFEENRMKNKPWIFINE